MKYNWREYYVAFAQFVFLFFFSFHFNLYFSFFFAVVLVFHFLLFDHFIFWHFIVNARVFTNPPADLITHSARRKQIFKFKINKSNTPNILKEASKKINKNYKKWFQFSILKQIELIILTLEYCYVCFCIIFFFLICLLIFSWDTMKSRRWRALQFHLKIANRFYLKCKFTILLWINSFLFIFVFSNRWERKVSRK